MSRSVETEEWRAKRREERAKIIVHLEMLEEIGLLQPLKELCRAHAVLLEAVLSSTRTKRVVEARLACCLYLRTLDMSYPEIGRLLRRDHTSIMALVRKDRRKVVDQFERAGLPAPKFDQKEGEIAAGADESTKT